MWDDLAKTPNEDVVSEDEKQISTKDLKLDNIGVLSKRKGLKILITGGSAVGKTRFCLSAPAPSLIIDTEMGVNALKSLAKDKDIKVHEVYCDNPNTFNFDAIKSLDELEKCIFYARNEGKELQTLCIDSMTSVWQWIQEWLRFEVERVGGKINKKGVPSDRRDWAKANTRHTSIVMALMNTEKHLILTAQAHSLYDAQGNMTGETKPSVQKNVPFLVDVVIELKKKRESGRNVYYGVVEKCRFPTNPNLEGTIIEDINFDKVYELLKNYI